MDNILKRGDFTGLAYNYSKSRPDYSKSVLKALIGLINKDITKIEMVDVGAGTGIWSRMALNEGINSIICIEPNKDMREQGIIDSEDTRLIWKSGSAEKTGLKDSSADFLTMASSFHWAKFNEALKEFHRVLRTEGRFCALWNPRLLEASPILLEIEEYLNELKPNIKRISSGRSGLTNTLKDDLNNSKYFEDIIYIEGRHIIKMSKDRYLMAWRSVNDLQVQLGATKFETFINFIDKKITKLEFIEATYLTRAWSAKKSNI